MCLISIQSVHKLQSRNEWMKGFPTSDVHEALASSCLKGLARDICDRSHSGCERNRALPGRSLLDLGFGQTVTLVVLEAKSRPMIRSNLTYLMAVWRNGSASDYESGGCRFEPYLGHIFSFSVLGALPTKSDFFFFLLGCTLLTGSPRERQVAKPFF